ncbi:MAG: DnaJ domain-containing protein [Syntrophobacteraceae bacterium]|nr:DnaJ domain-containing protein [Syntrophobacteraceae bacterium]
MAPEVEKNEDYRALGLEPGAGASEVKHAYRRLVKKWHPDRHHMESYEARALAEEKFREIDEAYRRIAKTLGEGSQPGRPEGGGESGSRPAAKRPERAYALKRRRGSFARFFSRPWPVRPATLSMAAAVFILALFLGLLTNIGSDRPTRELRKAKRPTPSEETKRAAQTKTALSPRLAPPARSLPEPRLSGDYFTLGSSDSRVVKVQGRPTRIQGDTWVYGVSEVNFRNGRVCGYNNFDGSLRVKIEPWAHGGRYTDHITIGSSKNQVLLVQGTPGRIEGNRWYYGFAELTFQDGLVAGYDNYFGTLKIRLEPSTLSGRGGSDGFFTQGSTPGEVLAVQGTPTAVHGKRWSYNFDYVFFRDGRVSGVIDADGALHFTNVTKPGATQGP